jgi:pSer/pThr/pTyr-binding forkhead associated (FHA) protein
MPKLILKKKAEVLDEFTMKSTQNSCTIGSDKFNNIVIHDKLVSTTHASIERRSRGYFIRDLNSAFGTYLNGQKVEDIAALKNGDLIQLGAHAIVFEQSPLEMAWVHAEPPPDETPAPFWESPPLLSSYAHAGATSPAIESAEKENATALQTFKKAETDWAPYYLLAIYGPYKGKRYQLCYGETKIGRDENLNDIILQKNPKGEADQSISRRHATIYFQNNSFFVRDKRSKTRTHVNQIMVPVDHDVEIFPGDELEIVSDQQSTIFRFCSADKLDCSPPKRAGVWWIRYQTHFKRALAAAALILGVLLLTNGFLERRLITQKPQPFTLALSQWGAEESGAPPSNDQGQSAALAPQPAAADCNHDGFVDIITTDISNKPLLIDGESKQPKWIIDTAPADPRAPFACADINQDGNADLVYVTNDGRLAAIDGLHGAEIWMSPVLTGQLIGPALVDDFDSDGLNDVAIANLDGVVHLGFNRVTDMEWFQIATEVSLHCPLASADLQNNGRRQLSVGTERGLVLIVDAHQRNIAKTIDINEELNRARGTFFEDNQIRHPVGTADLNGDKKLDYVVTTLQGRILAIDGASNSRLWFEVFTDELTLNGPALPFAFGHFDGEARPDVVSCTTLGEIRAYCGAGDQQQPKIIWRARLEQTAPPFPDLAAVDVNKDGVTDVAFVEAAKLKVLDGRNGEELLPPEPLPFNNFHQPLVADLSNDGRLDLFLANKAGLVYQFQSNSKIPPASVLWGQKYGQSRHALAQTSPLPPTFKADVAIAMGLLMFIGTGAATFWAQWRRRRIYAR